MRIRGFRHAHSAARRAGALLDAGRVGAVLRTVDRGSHRRKATRERLQRRELEPCAKPTPAQDTKQRKRFLVLRAGRAAYELTDGYCNCNSNGLWHDAHRRCCRCYLGDYSSIDARFSRRRRASSRRKWVRTRLSIRALSRSFRLSNSRRLRSRSENPQRRRACYYDSNLHR